MFIAQHAHHQLSVVRCHVTGYLVAGIAVVCIVAGNMQHSYPTGRFVCQHQVRDNILLVILSCKTLLGGHPGEHQP